MHAPPRGVCVCDIAFVCQSAGGNLGRWRQCWFWRCSLFSLQGSRSTRAEFPSALPSTLPSHFLDSMFLYSEECQKPQPPLVLKNRPTYTSNLYCSAPPIYIAVLSVPQTLRKANPFSTPPICIGTPPICIAVPLGNILVMWSSGWSPSTSVVGHLHCSSIRQEERAQRLTLWVWRLSRWGGRLPREGGSGSKSSCPPSKVCLPWVSKGGIWDVPRISPGCPGPLGVFKTLVQKIKCVHFSASVLDLGARLRGRTATQRSKKGSRKGSGEGFSEGF